VTKYSTIFVLGIFLGITLSNVYSQENQSSINILNWDSLYTEPIAVDSNFLKSDAVILYKTMDIKIPEATFSGVQKSEPYIFVTVFQRVKILNDNGVYDFTRVTLPENYDPFFDPKVKVNPYHLNSYSSISDFRYRIFDFDVRIIKDGKRVYTPELREEQKIDTLEYADDFHRLLVTKYNFSPVFKGDEVQIFYKIGILHDTKYSRFFISGKYPIQELKVSISEKYHNAVKSSVVYSNRIKELVEETENKQKEMHLRKDFFTLKNIFPLDCTNEFANCQSAPYFAINFRSNRLKDLIINGEKQENIVVKSGIFMGGKHYKPKKKDKEYFESKVNDTNLALKRFYENFKSDTSIKNDYERMYKIHNEINTFSTYETKPNYDKYDQFPPNRAELLKKKVFRSKYAVEIYDDLYKRCDSSFYNIYLFDKRYNDYTFNEAAGRQPFYNLFGIKVGSTFNYIFPQTTFARYYFNEIPYYLENSTAVFVPHNVDTNTVKDVAKNNVLVKKSPKSLSSENFRQIAGKLDYNEVENIFEFNGKESLSGQFSTILRNYYRTKLFDPVISKKHYKPLFKDEVTSSLFCEQVSSSDEYPYKINYKKWGKLKILSNRQTPSNIVELETKNLFVDVLPDADFLSCHQNHYDFYPEFPFLDKYRIQICFPFEVEIIEALLPEVSEENENISLVYSISKIDSKTFLFDLKYEIKQHHYSKETVSDVIKIAELLSQLSSKSIKFKKLKA
jgi:hypothetical protein